MGGNGSEHLQELSLVTKVSFKVGYISLKGMRNRTQRKSCADFQPGPHCLFGTVVLETLPCWEKTVSHIGALVHKPSWGPQPKTALTVAMWVRHLEHPAGSSLHVTPLPAAEERPRATRTQLGLTNLQKHKRPVPSPGCLLQTVPWAVGLETTGIHSLTIRRLDIWNQRVSRIIHVQTQSCLTLGDPNDRNRPGSSGHGILQARILERVAISFSRDSSWPRDQTSSPALAGGFFTTSTIWEALSRVLLPLKPLGEDPSPSLPASSLSLLRCSSAYGSITSRSASIFLRPSSLRVSCIQISLF